MTRVVRRRARRVLAAGLCGAAVVTAMFACRGPTGHPTAAGPSQEVTRGGRDTSGRPAGPHGTVTLAFAGDVHFEYQLDALLDHPLGALGAISGTLSDADLTMVNLESAVTGRGEPDAKEREAPDERYWFRTDPAAFDVLADAGVDIVTMANNHGADYGPVGLRDTLAAIRTSPVHVVGVGRDRRAAFTPYQVSVRGTDFAFFGADASMREGSSSVWAAGPTTPGLAAAHADRPRALVAAVRAADSEADVVVVYMHWGEEFQGCPTHRQRTTAQALADAGADIVVGSHAHVLLGSGWLDDTYVDYGLGNFLWYHDHEPVTGVLEVTVRDGEVVDDSWSPALIGTYGRPHPLQGRGGVAAVADWRRLRGCSGLDARPVQAHPRSPAYSWSVRRIGPRLEQRMTSSHRPGCPVPLSDLRYLQMTYVGFDGRVHTGELVVHRDYASEVAGVFERLYAARWPIRRMRLVDDYGGVDARSMAADNTSGYNCREVAGSSRWSAHAYGTAIDIDPVENPDLTGGAVAPRAGRRFAAADRSDARQAPPGVITADGPVVRAFARIGWEWGGTWSSGKDYQHFFAP